MALVRFGLASAEFRLGSSKFEFVCVLLVSAYSGLVSRPLCVELARFVRWPLEVDTSGRVDRCPLCKDLCSKLRASILPTAPVRDPLSSRSGLGGWTVGPRVDQPGTPRPKVPASQDVARASAPAELLSKNLEDLGYRVQNTFIDAVELPTSPAGPPITRSRSTEM